MRKFYFIFFFGLLGLRSFGQTLSPTYLNLAGKWKFDGKNGQMSCPDVNPDPMKSFNFNDYKNDPIALGSDSLIVLRSDSTYSVYPGKKTGTYSLKSRPWIMNVKLLEYYIVMKGIEYQIGFSDINTLGIGHEYKSHITAGFTLVRQK